MDLLTQKIPNKYERINEIKYKIPMKWTKQFNVDDVVPHKDKLDSAIINEGGMVNNYMKMKRKLQAKKRKKSVINKLSESVQPPTSHMNTNIMQDISTPYGTNQQKFTETFDAERDIPNAVLTDREELKSSDRHNETDGFSQMQKKPIFSNKVGQFNVPLSNMMLKESLSSRQDSPNNQTTLNEGFPQPGGNGNSKTLLQKQKQHLNPDEDDMVKNKQYEDQPDQIQNKMIREIHVNEREYQPEMEEQDDRGNVTDHDIIQNQHRQAFDYDQHQVDSPRTEQFDDQSQGPPSRGGPLDYSQIRPQYKPPKYNIDEIEHLFVDGKIPEEIHNIEDPMEYNYLLVKLKKEFNDKTRSEFLKYMNLQLPYNSRRDEVGGVITEDDWGDFVTRMDKMIRRVKRKRRRIIRRRKKNGKKLMPRKTLFKPKKKPNLAKNPLWREIFLDEDSEDSTVEDTEIFEYEKFKIPDVKPKRKFFEKEDNFKLPALFKPLIKGMDIHLVFNTYRNQGKAKGKGLHI